MDLLLIMAASENDAPKVAELLRAGADASIRVRPICMGALSTGWCSCCCIQHASFVLQGLGLGIHRAEVVHWTLKPNIVADSPVASHCRAGFAEQATGSLC